MRYLRADFVEYADRHLRMAQLNVPVVNFDCDRIK